MASFASLSIRSTWFSSVMVVCHGSSGVAPDVPPKRPTNVSSATSVLCGCEICNGCHPELIELSFKTSIVEAITGCQEQELCFHRMQSVNDPQTSREAFPGEQTLRPSGPCGIVDFSCSSKAWEGRMCGLRGTPAQRKHGKRYQRELFLF